MEEGKKKKKFNLVHPVVVELVGGINLIVVYIVVAGTRGIFHQAKYNLVLV